MVILASYGWAKWCLDIDSASGKDDGKTAEMIIGDLEYCTDLGNRAAVGCKKSDSDSVRMSTLCKMLSNNTAHYREIFFEGKSVYSANFILKLPQPVWANTTLISQQSLASRQEPSPAKTLQPVEGSDDG